MTTAAAAPEAFSPTDPVTAELSALLARLGELALHPAETTDTARIDSITILERIKAAAAAAQFERMVAFARSQVDLQLTQALQDARAFGRGIGDQIALACHVSPFEGSKRLGIARVLHVEMPHTAALLREGRISEYVAGLVVSETRHLSPELRGQVDARLADKLPGLSPRQAEKLARKYAMEADQKGYLQRGRTRRGQRGVSIRPAPDTMSLLTGFLPVEQGVACYAALRRHTDTLIAKGDARTRGQIMADTLTERLTGQTTATDVNVEVGIVMPIDALLDPASTSSADITGYGPIPTAIVRDILADTTGRAWWRRLFTMPDGGPLIGGDPKRRRFDGWLAKLIRIRDSGTCRDPFCDAPIRHIDHIVQRRHGGPTSYTNGRGECARGNFVREMPGWTVEVVDDGLGSQPHTVRTTTPTGHTYTNRAGPSP